MKLCLPHPIFPLESLCSGSQLQVRSILGSEILQHREGDEPEPVQAHDNPRAAPEVAETIGRIPGAFVHSLHQRRTCFRVALHRLVVRAEKLWVKGGKSFNRH
eukprot:CAMPEP_0172838168 /NCGR_PEP_ID=MMETSP1075-20121228/27684_1 /TAXON_ID=2916 /ORGANISM="Ceratium fusus, Strain PA161109" /LENGTH=102 /DNA_ID=CAMNT_0013681639 /DNA_START=862 /DNA_END=1170 /DNA_ORIENTATION=-